MPDTTKESERLDASRVLDLDASLKWRKHVNDLDSHLGHRGTCYFSSLRLMNEMCELSRSEEPVLYCEGWLVDKHHDEGDSFQRYPHAWVMQGRKVYDIACIDGGQIGSKGQLGLHFKAFVERYLRLIEYEPVNKYTMVQLDMLLEGREVPLEESEEEFKALPFDEKFEGMVPFTPELKGWG